MLFSYSLEQKSNQIADRHSGIKILMQLLQQALDSAPIFQLFFGNLLRTELQNRLFHRKSRPVVEIDLMLVKRDHT